MITEKGNILKINRGIVVHQVNCKGKMGAGIALKIRKQWPKVYDDYTVTYELGKLDLGTVIMTPVEEDLWVASIAGQNRYGREKGVVYTDYDAVEEGLNKLANFRLQKAPNLMIYIPRGMGCTLAGGDWEKMEILLNKYLPHDKIISLT